MFEDGFDIIPRALCYIPIQAHHYSCIVTLVSLSVILWDLLLFHPAPFSFADQTGRVRFGDTRTRHQNMHLFLCQPVYTRQAEPLDRDQAKISLTKHINGQGAFSQHMCAVKYPGASNSRNSTPPVSVSPKEPYPRPTRTSDRGKLPKTHKMCGFVLLNPRQVKHRSSGINNQIAIMRILGTSSLTKPRPWLVSLGLIIQKKMLFSSQYQGVSWHPNKLSVLIQQLERACRGAALTLTSSVLIHSRMLCSIDE